MPPVPSEQRISQQVAQEDYEQATLHWFCGDRSNVVTTLVQETLSCWAKKQAIHLHQHLSHGTSLGQQPIGLSVWAAWEHNRSISKSLFQLRQSQPATVKVVFVWSVRQQFSSGRGWSTVDRSYTLFAAEALSIMATDTNGLSKHHELTRGIGNVGTDVNSANDPEKNYLFGRCTSGLGIHQLIYGI